MNIIQLLPLCKGNIAICSFKASNIILERSPRIILLVESEQSAMLPAHKDNNCFIVTTICFKNQNVEHRNCRSNALCHISFAVTLINGEFGVFAVPVVSYAVARLKSHDKVNDIRG